ncbi:MAG: hypothetical protein ACI4WG_03745 [Erysipelotrichaceae bacterium]
MRYQDLTELKVTGKKIAVIGYKPYVAYVLTVILVFVMCIPLYKPLGIVAMVLLTIMICHFIMTNNKPTIAVYDSGLVIYDPRNKNKGRFIAKDKIISYHLSNYNRIEIQCEKEEVLVETFQIVKAVLYLAKVAKRS